MSKTAHLKSRAIVCVDGEEAEHFLQNLITCDLETLDSGATAFGALLTPQGKILFDFLIHRLEDRFMLDIDSSQADDFAKRLTFYRLRAKVGIERTADDVYVTWPGSDERFADPRGAQLGFRTLETSDSPAATEADWEAHRISLGFPECCKDFEPGDVFPHEALMDHFGQSGVDFSKGCYVGQEVVSRMQHRGTARSRFLKVMSRASGDLPAPGTEVKSADRTIGKMGSSSGNIGLALLRLDRVSSAMNEGAPLTADGVVIEVSLPGFATFDWPQ